MFGPDKATKSYVFYIPSPYYGYIPQSSAKGVLPCVGPKAYGPELLINQQSILHVWAHQTAVGYPDILKKYHVVLHRKFEWSRLNPLRAVHRPKRQARVCLWKQTSARVKLDLNHGDIPCRT